MAASQSKRYFFNPLAKSQKQMEKMQRDLEKEKKEMDKLHDLTMKEREDKVSLDETFFYPSQTNKFPKYVKPGEKTEAQKAQEMFKEEIQKQRNEILSDEEYTTMLEDSEKRQMTQIAIFRASRQSVSSLSAMTAAHRLSTLLFLLYLPLLMVNTMGATATLYTQLYGGTFGSATFALIFRTFKMRIARDFVLRIDFDVKTEAFIVTIPPSSITQFGEPEQLTVSTSDFQMLTQVQQKARKGCLYHDAKTLRAFATIERGQWYNQGLLLYLLQKHRVVPVAPTTSPQDSSEEQSQETNNNVPDRKDQVYWNVPKNENRQ